MTEQVRRKRNIATAVTALAVAISVAGFASSSIADSAAPAKSPALTGRLQKQSNGWCAGYRFGQLSSAERLADPNRRRLLAAQSVLAPTFAAGKAKDGIALLANYQTEMESVRPDRVLAATYLALTSAQPINAKLVERVNGLLCVSASAKAAQGVAVIADAEWREMSR